MSLKSEMKSDSAMRTISSNDCANFDADKIFTSFNDQNTGTFPLNRAHAEIRLRDRILETVVGIMTAIWLS